MKQILSRSESIEDYAGELPAIEPVKPKIRIRKVEAIGVAAIALILLLGLIGFIKPESGSGAELIGRIAVIFAVLTAGFRVLGKRELSQMSPFELVTLLLVAEIVSPSLTAGDDSLPGAIIGAAALLFFTFVNSVLTYRIRWFRSLGEAPPSVVIYKARLIEQTLHRDRLRPDEILSEMHKAGIASLEEVEWGFLEPDGRLSFIQYDRSQNNEARESKIA